MSRSTRPDSSPAMRARTPTSSSRQSTQRRPTRRSGTTPSSSPRRARRRPAHSRNQRQGDTVAHGKFDTPLDLPTPAGRTLSVTGPIRWDGDSAGDRPASRVRIQTLSVELTTTDSLITGHARPDLTIDRPANRPAIGDFKIDIDTDDPGEVWAPGRAIVHAVVRITTEGSGIRGSRNWDEPWDEVVWLS